MRVWLVSQMAPLSLYSALLLPRAIWALVKSRALNRGVLFKTSALHWEEGTIWDKTCVSIAGVMKLDIWGLHWSTVHHADSSG